MQLVKQGFSLPVTFLIAWFRMDRYQRVEKPREDTPISENEIRITALGRMRNYISYALTLLQVRLSVFFPLYFTMTCVSFLCSKDHITKFEWFMYQPYFSLNQWGMELTVRKCFDDAIKLIQSILCYYQYLSSRFWLNFTLKAAVSIVMVFCSLIKHVPQWVCRYLVVLLLLSWLS